MGSASSRPSRTAKRKKTAQRVDRARHRPRGQSFAAESADEVGHVRLAQLQHRALVTSRVRGQASEIARVGLEGVRRHRPLDAQVIEVLGLDPAPFPARPPARPGTRG